MSGARLLGIACAALVALDARAADVPEGKAMDTKPNERGVTIVCFGDSLTGHRPGPQPPAAPPKFAALLEADLRARGFSARVINSGWAGDRTDPKPSEGWPGAVARAPTDILAHRPDIAVILIGGNDPQRGDADRARTRANLRAIAAGCRDAGIRTLLLLYPPPLPAPEHAAKGWRQLAEKNPLIAAVAAELGLPTLDMGPPMLAAARAIPRGELVNPVDGVHLHPRGERVFADAILARLTELSWLETPRDQKE